MSAIQVRITFAFSSETDPERVFDSIADALFDQEAASESLFDADVTADLAAARISLSVVGKGASAEAASVAASEAIRTAIESGGGASPSWHTPTELSRHETVFTLLEETAAPAY